METVHVALKVFYAEELQKVHKSDDIYKIENILAEKKKMAK